MKCNDIDFDARYRVKSMPGVAFYLRGYHEDWGDVVDDWEVPELRIDKSMVRAVMVGDDREHIVDIEDLEPLAEDGYCSVCGQIGCGHNF